MRKIVSGLTVVLLLLGAGTILAQDEERDILEVSLYGGAGVPGGGLTDWRTGEQVGSPVDRAAKTGFDIGIDAGVFVTHRFLLGVNFVYTQFPFDKELEQSGHNHRLYNPNVFVKYLFEGESYWVPYVKGHIGIDFPKFSTKVNNTAGRRFRELSYDLALGFGGGVGLFYYTADFSGLFIEANYHYGLTENVKADYENREYEFGKNLSLFDIHAGFRILFGSGD
ncbi:MAG: hypothetical protein AB1744_11210 [Candidatus Zixiibacteriota bacterium]